MIIKLNWHRRVHFVQRLLLILYSEYLLGFFRLVLQVNFNICLILLMYLSFLCMVKKQMFWGISVFYPPTVDRRSVACGA